MRVEYSAGISSNVSGVHAADRESQKASRLFVHPDSLRREELVTVAEPENVELVCIARQSYYF